MGRRKHAKFKTELLSALPKYKYITYNGIETSYIVTENGRVYATNYRNAGSFCELPQFDRKGYKVVNLNIDNKETCVLVHRLVALAFIENPRNCPEVNHEDGNKSNNSVENLIWVTKSENRIHGISTGLITFHNGEDHHFAKITKKTAKKICKMLEKNVLTIDEIAEVAGTTRGTVYSIKYGDSWLNVSKNYNVKNHSVSKKRVYTKERKKVGSILDQDTVIKICTDLSETTDSVQTIADKYNIPKTRVESILYRNSWKKISENFDFSSRHVHNSKHHKKG